MFFCFLFLFICSFFISSFFPVSDIPYQNRDISKQGFRSDSKDDKDHTTFCGDFADGEKVFEEDTAK